MAEYKCISRLHYFVNTDEWGMGWGVLHLLIQGPRLTEVPNLEPRWSLRLKSGVGGSSLLSEAPCRKGPTSFFLANPLAGGSHMCHNRKLRISSEQ